MEEGSGSLLQPGGSKRPGSPLSLLGHPGQGEGYLITAGQRWDFRFPLGFPRWEGEGCLDTALRVTSIWGEVGDLYIFF